MPRKSPAKPEPAARVPENLPDRLLAWYDRHRRLLPWRAGPGERADPYHVWLSEIMLQQTTVVTVGPYFRDFLARWPRLEDLAAAPLDDVLTAWAGLGYYARARNLKKCAEVVAAEHGGVFPDSEEDLLALPGIGPYTAAAIAAIAFDRPATILDGNVERVMARLYRVEAPLPKAKAELRALARRHTPEYRPGDYAQGIMDLGATICTPTKPKCALCPLTADCAALKAGDAETYPRKAAKAERPQRYGLCFAMIDRQGRIALEKRPEKGLLGGMMQVPTSAWRDTPFADGEVMPPVAANWRKLDGQVSHVFTHFALSLTVLAATRVKADPAYRWVGVDELGRVALPSVMRKVVDHVLAKSA
ncbi:A/G-specific DNA-adenine glycosylase [Dongia mobilis]|uniref:Adenine DNA glycosylase n=1 Tax=Dongia mobilis TaxID=578943 RepID=A0A4R6WTN7_9PROT|nr:A/G-specific adenine glycosylase [Dongia mobilis]TDQ82474.1 A/G-specific DNA-adenine glycosylase [Dongia mobilis]